MNKHYGILLLLSSFKQLIENVSRQQVQLLYSHWMTLHGVFLDLHDEYAQLLNEEDRDVHNVNWLQPKLQKVELFQSRIREWFEKDSIK
jgi:hypothetical protein